MIPKQGVTSQQDNSTGDETFISKRITNQDVYTKLCKMEELQGEILEHAKFTNGRLAKVEAKSLGLWITNHPFQFTAYVLVAVSVLISDIRHPVIDLITGLI